MSYFVASQKLVKIALERNAACSYNSDQSRNAIIL